MFYDNFIRQIYILLVGYTYITVKSIIFDDSLLTSPLNIV